MKREQVVVFDGEDKFIAPKSRTYNKKIGKSEFVGVVESPEGNKAPISTIDGDAFNDYMRKKDLPAVLPSPSEPDFCAKAQAFIQTNGDGRATPEQIMQAYQMFQDNCVEKPKEVKPVESDSPPPVTPDEEQPVFPVWETLDCETLASEISRLEQTMTVSKLSESIRGKYETAISQGKSLQDTRCPKAPPVLGSMPSSSSPLGVSLSAPNLGKPPAKLGGAPAGGGGEEKEEPKKGTNWLLWLLIGGATLYFVTRKK